MAKLVEIALKVVYPLGPVERLFWIADVPIRRNLMLGK
jgi:hypothetical protein